MEIWKEIKGYEELYKVSNLGNVKSINHFRVNGFSGYMQKGRILKFSKDRCGYLLVRLSKNGVAKTYRLHRIVALTFIDNPLNKKTVNHINGNKLDNRVENLEWATQKEQIEHQHKVLNIPYSDCKFCHEANKKKVIRNDGKIYNSISEAKEDLGKKHAHITEVCQGKKKSTYGYSFKYLKEGE